MSRHTNVSRRGFITTRGCGLGTVGLLAAVGEPVTADQGRQAAVKPQNEKEELAQIAVLRGEAPIIPIV